MRMKVQSKVKYAMYGLVFGYMTSIAELRLSTSKWRALNFLTYCVFVWPVLGAGAIYFISKPLIKEAKEHIAVDAAF